MANKPDYDVVIVGAGAAGGILARELTDAGLQVCLLERGPFFETKDLTMDELRFPIRQNLLWATPRTGGMTWRPHARSGTQKVFPRITHMMDGWGPGGTMNHWGGTSWRYYPETFRHLDVWGQIPNGAIANWPIAYEELEPYYEKFEYRFGVSGDADQILYGPPRKKPYPLPPIEQGYATNHFARACRSLGYKPFPMPTAILSQDYQGRSRTGYCGYCQAFECTIDAKSNTRITEIEEARKKPNFTLLTDHYVVQVTMKDQERVEGVVCLDAAGQAKTITGSIVILSANTLYNVWLLLVSKNHYAPGGIGNQNGQVGKYFHHHPRFGVNGQFAEKMHVHIGPSESLTAVTEFTENHFDHTGLGFVMGGYIYGARVTGSAGLPIEYAQYVELPEGVSGWGPSFKQFIEQTYSFYYQVHTFLTDPPLLSSFIDLDPGYKNGLGLPLPRITFDWSPQLKNMHRFFHEKVVGILRAGEAKRIWGGNLSPPWYLSHPSGGTRMGENTSESVTDRYGKVHGLNNLYIAGNSLFPTMPCFNVTETIGALAYWQADHIRHGIEHGAFI
ncbi:GMC family oxidoreductase [Ferviditalea candida]|uniref:GMC family oxidoreductase n=1 Tax=Ferviditalea candida TaxID=3108399 RepID=A0ABU5ZJ89_9BACL|nr:GMC family oxidoreductase [Paenibacillaceae bacterium T2]